MHFSMQFIQLFLFLRVFKYIFGFFCLYFVRLYYKEVKAKENAKISLKWAEKDDSAEMHCFCTGRNTPLKGHSGLEK